MSDIPEDLIADVLSRLPVETLLRFRCVSKQWCALIDSPNFINLQLNQHKTSTNLIMIFEFYYLPFSVAFDYILKHDDHNNLPPAKLDYTLLKFGEFDIIGSYNGLICLQSLSNSTFILLNPSTKKYQLLPPAPPLMLNVITWGFHGFGYDPVNDDYKIVRITRYSNSFHNEVIVYSLRWNIWRRIDYNFPHCLGRHTRGGVFFNGALHWVATHQPESRVGGCISCIIAFDLVNENYRELQLPKILGNRRMTLLVSGGCLFLICIGDNDDDRIDDDVIVELWVMKDYMVQESWTKLSIAFLSQLQVYKPIWNVRILAYSNSSKEVLLTQINDTLCWLDLKEQKIVDLDIRSHGVEICIPSLVKLPCHLGTNVL